MYAPFFSRLELDGVFTWIWFWFFISAIIEEELDEHHFELKLAAKNNDTTRAGWLHIYQDGKWDLCWTTLNTQRVLCNRDDSVCVMGFYFIFSIFGN